MFGSTLGREADALDDARQRVGSLVGGDPPVAGLRAVVQGGAWLVLDIFAGHEAVTHGDEQLGPVDLGDVAGEAEELRERELQARPDGLRVQASRQCVCAVRVHAGSEQTSQSHCVDVDAVARVDEGQCEGDWNARHGPQERAQAQARGRNGTHPDPDLLGELRLELGCHARDQRASREADDDIASGAGVTHALGVLLHVAARVGQRQDDVPLALELRGGGVEVRQCGVTRLVSPGPAKQSNGQLTHRMPSRRVMRQANLAHFDENVNLPPTFALS